MVNLQFEHCYPYAGISTRTINLMSPHMHVPFIWLGAKIDNFWCSICVNEMLWEKCVAKFAGAVVVRRKSLTDNDMRSLWPSANSIYLHSSQSKDMHYVLDVMVRGGDERISMRTGDSQRENMNTRVPIFKI